MAGWMTILHPFHISVISGQWVGDNERLCAMEPCLRLKMTELGNFQCRGALLICIILGQGPSVLAVGVGGGCLEIFSLVFHFSFSFSLSPGDSSIQTEILSQRAFRPKTTNQP